MQFKNFSYADLQMICGFSCEELAGMFKELRGLGVVVQELSKELRKVVRRKVAACRYVQLYIELV